MKYKNKSGTINNRGNWNHLKITQKISELRTWKARHEGNTENNHIRHSANTYKNTNVKLQIYHWN